MSRRDLALCIYSDAVHAALVRDGKVLWRQSRARQADESLTDTIAQLCQGVNETRWTRIHLSVSVCPSEMPFKPLTVPPKATRTHIAAATAVSPARFFPMASDGVITHVAPMRNGRYWGSAVRGALLDGLVGLCQSRRWTLEGVTPALSVLAKGLKSGKVRYTERQCQWSAEVSHGVVIALTGGVRFAPAPPTTDRAMASEIEVAPELLLTCRRPVRTVDAHTPMQVRRATIRTRWRRHMLVGACVLSALGSFLAPDLRRMNERTDAAERLRQVQGPLRDLDALQRRLALLQNQAAVVSRFGSPRSVTMLLGHLTNSLPDSTAIVSLRVDSTSATITTVSPIGTAVLSGLLDEAEFVTVRTVGSAVRETIAGARVQREAFSILGRRAVHSAATGNPARIRGRPAAAITEAVP